MGIRSAAKAIIIQDGKVLLNRCQDKLGRAYYSLPGGGQNQYETLHEALVRECLEETGYTVRPVRFAAMFEEICDDADIRERYPNYAHKIYHIFLCEPAGLARQAPTEIDLSQQGSEWIAVESLGQVPLFPKTVGEHARALIDGCAPMFLGSEHTSFAHG